MDNKLWKCSNACCASCTINKYTFFTHWFCWGKNVLPWLLTASLLSFSLSSPLSPSPPLSTPIDNDSSNMHSCSLTGRAFEIYCYIAGVLLWVWIQLGLSSFCVCCACCSPIWSRLCLKCLWYKPLQFWLRLRVLLPLGLKNTLHLNLCLHPWQCKLMFGLAKCLLMPKKTENILNSLLFFFHFSFKNFSVSILLSV